MKTPCLMYHQIPEGTPDGKFWTPFAAFAEQILWLKREGYVSIDLEAPEPLKTENGVLITFDDGHRSNLKAAQLLRDQGLKAVFYVLKNKSLLDPDYLAEDDIRSIAEMGHLIGVHGKDHKWWTGKTAAQLCEEFGETKAWIESLTKRPVVTCSAPGGILDRETVQTLRKNFPDVKYIRSSICSYNEPGNAADLLNAMAIGRETTLDEFQRIITIDRGYYGRKYALYLIKDAIKRVLRMVKGCRK